MFGLMSQNPKLYYVSRNGVRFLYKSYMTQTAQINSKISHCARTGEIDAARQLFDEMPSKSIVSWNAIIAGYFQNKRPREAKRVFDEMPERNMASWNGLISGYMKSGMVSKATEMFARMPERNVVSWTIMVKGYLQEGMVKEAEELFWRMPEKNVVSWSVMMSGLIEDGRVDEAKRVYDMMPEKDVISKTIMIEGLCLEGMENEARAIFDGMRKRNVITWTCMINGYARTGKVDVARKLFEVMPHKNEVTWTAMLIGYIRSGRIKDAIELFEVMPVKGVGACNEMILGYGENGEVRKATELFQRMREKDHGTWSALIKVYGRRGYELKALSLFRSMQKEGFRPNFPSMISILSVCGSLASLDYGRQIHAQSVRSWFDVDVYVSSALITTYVKCGDLVKARMLFDRFDFKDTAMWNSTISGYGQHGLGEESLKLFYEMVSTGARPDDITLISVLSACSYSGKVEQGLEIFEAMKCKYQIDPKIEHYACMVDLLGRAGRLSDAMNLIENMPIEADTIIWGSLLGACRNHAESGVAELAAKRLAQLEPENTGPYVLLSNIYASQGRWRDVLELRKTMKARNISKSPGCSWLEVDKKVHMFTGGDSKGHPESEDILKMLEKLGGLITEAGYCPDRSFVLHDLDEEEKVHSLQYHSEKLAIAYGLLKVPEGMPIRVMKNLRVCGDCHSAIKIITKVTRREIILRDANRFHHFKDGICSCKDYW